MSPFSIHEKYVGETDKKAQDKSRARKSSRDEVPPVKSWLRGLRHHVLEFSQRGRLPEI